VRCKLTCLSGVSNSRSPIESARQENDASVSVLASSDFEIALNNFEGFFRYSIQCLDRTTPT